VFKFEAFPCTCCALWYRTSN